jgi:DNA ligase-associated metallophosphoesterase
VRDYWAAAPAYSDDAMATPILRFAGHMFEPLPSGGLHWPSQKALLVADLHLEKLSSFARRGSLLPPYDTAMTLKRLAADLTATGAEHVISLGDSFHRDEGTTTLLDDDRMRLDTLMEQARWIWISGNHDPSPHALGGDCVTVLERAGLTLTHHPRRGPAGIVAGHLHPAARIVVNGRSVRRACFVHDGATLVLPAYGSSAGTINILSPPFLSLFDWGKLEVMMIGRSRIYPVSAKRLVGGAEY